MVYHFRNVRFFFFYVAYCSVECPESSEREIKNAPLVWMNFVFYKNVNLVPECVVSRRDVLQCEYWCVHRTITVPQWSSHLFPQETDYT